MSTRHSNVDASVCSFTFADGRRCRTPRCMNHAHLCYFHAQKEAQANTTRKITHDIGTWLIGDYVSAGDLATALGQVIAFTARGNISRKTATTVGYLSQTLIQAIKLSQHEYINAWGADQWRRVIRGGTKPPPAPPLPKPAPALSPATSAAPDSPETSSPASAQRSSHETK